MNFKEYLNEAYREERTKDLSVDGTLILPYKDEFSEYDSFGVTYKYPIEKRFASALAAFYIKDKKLPKT